MKNIMIITIINIIKPKLTSAGFLKLTKKTLISFLICLMIFTSSGLFYLFNPFVKKSEAAWFDANWAFRKPVNFTHNAAVSNTQVELDIDTTDSPTNFQADCGDVRFTDINGNLLRYYLDSAAGACDTASTDFDVLIPTIVNGSNTIFMYYGNPSAPNGTEVADFSETTTTPSGGAPSAATEEKGPGPTLYWAFNDATGTNAEDFSSNALDGTLNNTPTWQTEDFCISGKCLWFDGTNNENVSRADNVALDFVAADNFSVHAWVKRNGASSAVNYILTKAQAGYTGYKLYQDASGDYCFDVSDGTNTDTACTSAVEFDNDQWHHVVGTKQGTTAIRLYVDGKERASDTSIAATGTLANTGTFYTGVDLDGTTSEWLGFIDEVKVYRDETVRTAAQVAADFNARGTSKGSSVILGSAATPGSTLSNGLVGYWQMQETATPSLDSSGNSNSGTWTGTTSTTGKFGNGNDFSGTDQYIQVADSASLDVTSVTLAAWVYADTLGTNARTIIQKSTSAGTDGYSMDIDTSSKIRYCGSGGCASSTTALTTGTWTHIAVAVDSSGTRFYLNGTLNGTSTANTSVPTNALVLRMGVDSTSISDYDGKIDEARVYNRALSGADVASLYNFTPSPVGYWKFDEKTGTAAEDSSGLGNQATLTNTPTWTQGKYGAAVSFAGSDQNVQRADDSDFDFGTGASFTYGAWIRHAASPATVERIITKYDTGAFQNGGFALQIETDGDLTCGIDDDETSFPEDSAASTAATYDDNLWHYVSCVKDGTTGLYLYIDGVLIASDTTISSTGDFTNADPLYIGIAEDGTSNDFIGQIDDPKIYNYARTAGQIVEDMNAGHPAPGSPVGSAVGYWKFDEGADNTCSGGTNDTCNSGNGGSTLDGAQSNMAVPATAASGWSNSGKFQKALQFDGTDDVVTVTNATSIDLNDNLAASHTFSAWFYAGSAGEGSAGQVYSKGTSTYLRTTTGAGGPRINASLDLATADATTGNVNISLNTWYHIAVTYTDDSDDEIDMYVNGILRASSTLGNGAPDTDTNDLLIGGTTTNNFDGRIDEFKIYNSALTASQVLQDMNRGSQSILGALSDNSSYEKNAANQEYCVPGDSTSCASPVGEWRLDEKTGTTAYDTSTTGNDLTLTNTPTWTTGKFGAALNFAGSDQQLTRADDSDFDFAGGASFVLEAWIKHSPTPSTQEEIISKFATQGYKLLMETDGDITCTITDSAAQTDSATSTAATYDDDKWHYVSCVKSASTSLTLYIDGAQVAQDASIAATSTLANTDPIYIGIDEDGISEDWIGQIDLVRIFNYARTSVQVAWDYNRGAPVGLWKMDECQGTTLNDASVTNTNNGTWTGSTGGNTSTGNCTTVDTATAWYNGRTGKYNSSLDFDGTDDVVTVTNATSIDLNDNLAASHTFSAWFYAGSAGEGSAGQIINKGTNTFIRLAATCCSTFIDIRLDLATTNATVTGPSISFNTWYHVVVTYTDDSDDEIDLYVNGLLSASSTNGVGSPEADTSDLLIGGPTTNNFDGQIDDVRIYNYALTATQIKTLYNSGAARFGPVTGSP